MADTPANAPPRWTSLVPVMSAIFGVVVVVLGFVTTLSAWRSQVDVSIANLQDRMKQAEANQKTYIPVLLGLTKDVSYLADRARREDDRLDREGRGRP